MSQRQELIQTQKQVQQQRLTQQQMLVVRMLEMPLNELEESVGAEIDDNPALETASAEDDYTMEESGDMGGNEVDGEGIVLEGCTGGEVRRNGEAKVTIRNCAGVAQD